MLGKLMRMAARAIPWVRRRPQRQKPHAQPPAPMILLYHSIAEVEFDPWSLSVSPTHFAEHLDVLRSTRSPMSLGELVRLTAEGRAPANAVALTFDDGYANNLLAAKPALERAEVPATIFIATGILDEDGEIWWDELARIMLGSSGTSPLRLRLPGGEREWPIGRDGLDADTMRAHHGWRASRDEPPTTRHRVLLEVHHVLRLLGPEERGMVMDQLRSWSGDVAARAVLRPLTESEVARLAYGSLVDIGAHTVTHPVLSALPPATQRAEMSASRERLAALLGRPVTTFAYPYGGREEYSVESVRITRDLGFDLACANDHSALRAPFDRHQLPRIVMRDWDGAELERRLHDYARD